MMGRPQFEDLSQQEQLMFGNGVGPLWMPDTLRAFITGFASWFFANASWRHHDFGYFLGGDRWDRARCDAKFLCAMLLDALRQRGLAALVKIPAALVISIVFYLLVRAFGQFGSFRYRDRPLQADELTNLTLSPARA